MGCIYVGVCGVVVLYNELPSYIQPVSGWSRRKSGTRFRLLLLNALPDVVYNIRDCDWLPTGGPSLSGKTFTWGGLLFHITTTCGSSGQIHTLALSYMHVFMHISYTSLSLINHLPACGYLRPRQ